ncbi:MAG: CAP domain-containing protein [Paracoccaceae bacterium]|jgi:uncharacterized protein YkwD
MARSLVALMVFCTFGVLWTTAASAAPASCNATLSSNASSRAVTADALDQALFNDAVLHYVNVERCNRGLTPLRSDNDLIQATSQHSAHMASNAYVSHNSRQAGYRELQDRLSKAKVQYRVAGENVIKSYVFAFNRQNIGSSGRACQFRFASNGSRVPRHTYNSLAKDLVALWMVSKTHRSNILHRDFSRAGATFGVDGNSSLCGTVYAAQNFAN